MIPELANEREGTFAAEIDLPWPWPPYYPVELVTMSLGKAVLSVQITVFGSLYAGIEGGDLPKREVLSCPLYQIDHTGCLLVVRWYEDDIDILLGPEDL